MICELYVPVKPLVKPLTVQAKLWKLNCSFAPLTT